MELEILSPNKKIYEGEAEVITLPGREGELQVLNDHATIFSLLDMGDIIIDGNKKVSIASGIVEVLENKIIILVKEMAIRSFST